MDQPAFIEVRKIVVGDGTLEVEMTQEFVDRVRQRFGLAKEASPTNDHVRAFVYEGIAKALDRAGG